MRENRLGRVGRFAWLNLGWLELWVAATDGGHEITLWLGLRRWIIRLRVRRPTTTVEPRWRD